MTERKTAAKTGLDLLREPFPAHQIGKLPKPYRSDSPKSQCRECGTFHGMPALHLDFVGHAALTDRLLDADPQWSWEPLALGPDGLPMLDRNGGLWIRLTVCGVTRLGYGDAQGKSGPNAIKEAIGDALRNAGMRFGIALDLWHKGDLHIEDAGKQEAERQAQAPQSDRQQEAEKDLQVERPRRPSRPAERSPAPSADEDPFAAPRWAVGFRTLLAKAMTENDLKARQRDLDSAAKAGAVNAEWARTLGTEIEARRAHLTAPEAAPAVGSVNEVTGEVLWPDLPPIPGSAA